MTGDSLLRLERIVRALPAGADDHPADPPSDAEAHPFDVRNLHPDFPKKVRSLYDDGHLAEAVFEAFKYVEKEVKRISKVGGQVGWALMMAAFDEKAPKIALNALASDSDTDEQKGYRHIFAGSSSAIRNPRGHEVDVTDTPDEALDYLALASLLLRRLDASGVR